MSLALCPNGLILEFAQHLTTVTDINALQRTNRRHYQLCNAYLYAYDVRIHYGTAMALGWAACRHNLVVAQKSVDAGANNNAIFEESFPCPHSDVYTEESALVCAVREAINYRQANGQARYDMIDLLVAAGADVGLVCPTGVTAMTLAVTKVDIELVKYIVHLDVRCLAANGWPVVIATHRDIEFLRSLRPALPYYNNDWLGQDALLYPIRRNALEKTQILLDCGRIDPNMPMSVLNVAYRHSNVDMVRLLLDHELVEFQPHAHYLFFLALEREIPDVLFLLIERASLDDKELTARLFHSMCEKGSDWALGFAQRAEVDAGWSHKLSEIAALRGYFDVAKIMRNKNRGHAHQFMASPTRR